MATISITHSTIPRKIPRELVSLSLLCVLGPVCLGMVQWTGLPQYRPVDRFASAWSGGTFVRFGTSLPQYGPVDQFASISSSGPVCLSMVQWTGLPQHGRVDRLASAWSSGPAGFSMVQWTACFSMVQWTGWLQHARRGWFTSNLDSLLGFSLTAV